MSCKASLALLFLRLDGRISVVVGIPSVTSWLGSHRLHYLPHRPFPHLVFKINQYLVRRWTLQLQNLAEICQL